ncbi:MAG: hypothetical protein EHM73_07225 [Chroococcales cyanobacterium metabat2.561]|nr:MAG: hypothetical protein EHM73_07225 [Chroococcales cyanobacterium metabat2.561]
MSASSVTTVDVGLYVDLLEAEVKKLRLKVREMELGEKLGSMERDQARKIKEHELLNKLEAMDREKDDVNKLPRGMSALVGASAGTGPRDYEPKKNLTGGVDP